MKTLSKIIALTGLLSIALIPMTASAVSYYPGYTCHYRDISGSCQNYQTSNPHFFRNTRANNRYGNRRSLNAFNAYEVRQSPWDNRFNNREGWKYYYDEDDDRVRQYYLEPEYWNYGRRHYDNYDYNYNNNGGYIEYEYTRVYIH